MRTFSRLRAFCSYPELIDKPSKRRDDAAALGTMFHRYIEQWQRCIAEGKPWHTDGAPEPVAGWLRRMREVWTPPPGLEVEVPLGLSADVSPAYVPVDEVAPHIYVPSGLGITAELWAHASDEIRQQWQAGLLTAGRADLVFPFDSAVVQVDDIKTGRFYLGDPKKLRQLLAQGFAAADRAEADAFLPGIYYARLGIFDRGDGEPIWRGSKEWDQAWMEVVASSKMPSAPRPGPWCLDCWSAKDCAANPAVEAA